jgi:hypothetical protein
MVSSVYALAKAELNEGGIPNDDPAAAMKKRKWVRKLEEIGSSVLDDSTNIPDFEGLHVW